MTAFSAKAFPFPMHSICVWQKGNILQEEYFGAFRRDDMHRMFSITKSFTSLAIGALISEGRLRLNDPIVKYFPEYTLKEPHPYLAQMTLYDMLTMRTCYPSTTYKIDMKSHWVKSFFTAPADHRPGQIFKYDTSSAHTMAALVQKISGRTVLDYLREIFLDTIGFSKEAHILLDPFGCEIGGSGLVCTTKDLLLVARLLLSLYNGTWENDYPDLAGCADSIYDRSFWKRYADYIREAMSYHVSTLHEGKTLDERQGYGFQFWLVRDGGVMMYGMGGQYIVLYPAQELIFVTTADTQMIGGGTQYILDEIRRVALSLGVTEGTAPALSKTLNVKESTCTNLPALLPQQAAAGTACINPALFGRWDLQPNRGGFTKLELNEKELILKTEDFCFAFPYGSEHPEKTKDPKYQQALYTQAYPQADGSLYLYTQILDEYMGSIQFMLQHKDGKPTLYIRKIEETYYQEFNGFFEAV